MGISNFIAALAVTSVLLLDEASHAVAYCICPAVYFTPCDYVQGAARPVPTTVVRATVLTKYFPLISVEADIIIYFTADVTTVYSGEDVDEVSFMTEGTCFVDLTEGEEYLLGLYPATVDSSAALGVPELLTVGACDLATLWSGIFPQELADLEAGCPADGCIPVCDDKQECVQYVGTGTYYCSDTCDNPDSCRDGKECTTRPRSWCRNSGFECCPERRKCR
ncbi:unnamed protein product [Scytosiphon promiscuus]